VLNDTSTIQLYFFVCPSSYFIVKNNALEWEGIPSGKLSHPNESNLPRESLTTEEDESSSPSLSYLGTPKTSLLQNHFQFESEGANTMFDDSNLEVSMSSRGISAEQNELKVPSAEGGNPCLIAKRINETLACTISTLFLTNKSFPESSEVAPQVPLQEGILEWQPLNRNVLNFTVSASGNHNIGVLKCGGSEGSGNFSISGVVRILPLLWRNAWT
jgi:hypothetical protein